MNRICCPVSENWIGNLNGTSCAMTRVIFKTLKRKICSPKLILLFVLITLLTTIDMISCEETVQQPQGQFPLSAKTNEKKVINDRHPALDELIQKFHASNLTGQPDHNHKEDLESKKLTQAQQLKVKEQSTEPLNTSSSQSSPEESSPESRGEAKGPILSGLGSLVAMNIIKKRCCSMRLCPCRFPGMLPGVGGIPSNVINGISVPGQPGMFPGMGGFQPGFGMGFPGFYPGMRPMGGGGGHSGGEELQEGFDESGYSIRPNGRPRRRRPGYVNTRPVGGPSYGPSNSIKWTSSSSPEGFDHPEETVGPVIDAIPGGIYTSTQTNGQSAFASNQVTHKTGFNESNQDNPSSYHRISSTIDKTGKVGRKLLAVEEGPEGDESKECFLHRENDSSDSLTRIKTLSPVTRMTPNRFKRSPSSSSSRRRSHSSLPSVVDQRDARGDTNNNRRDKKRRDSVDQSSPQASSFVGGRTVSSTKNKKRDQSTTSQKHSSSQGISNHRMNKRMKGSSDYGDSSSSSSPPSSGSSSVGSSSTGSRSRTRNHRIIGWCHAKREIMSSYREVIILCMMMTSQRKKNIGKQTHF